MLSLLARTGVVANRSDIATPEPQIEIKRKNVGVLAHRFEQFSGIYAELFACSSAQSNELEIVSPMHCMLMRCNGIASRLEIAWPEDGRKMALTELKPGGILFSPASCSVHLTKKDHGQFEYLSVRVPPSALDELDPELVGPQRLAFIPQAGEGQTELCRVLFAIREEIKESGPAGQLYKETLALQLLVQMLRCASNLIIPPKVARGGLSSRQLRRAIELLETDLTCTPSLQQLAEEVGLSPTHLCMAFKQSTGHPPHRYLLHRRVARAKSLMADPKLSLTEIALSSGFGSSSQFATAFPRIDGKTPSAYRRGL